MCLLNCSQRNFRLGISTHMQTIIVGTDLDYHEILDKEYKTIWFSEEYHNHPNLGHEEIKIKNNELHIYAFQDSPFYHYFLQNIPKCDKLMMSSRVGNYPDASLLTKVKKLELSCYQGSARITPEYLESLKDIPIVKGVRYYPEYKDIDFTNIYCEYPKIDEIPTSVKYLKIIKNIYSSNCVKELYDRMMLYPGLERLTLCFVPTPEELELLVKMPIKSFRVVDVVCEKDISCVIRANLFEKMNVSRCSLSEKSLEGNYVMTKFVIYEEDLKTDENKEVAEYIKQILERNKRCKSDMRFFRTKVAPRSE